MQKDDSDLDLFIVGEHDPKAIRAVGERYGVDISIKTCSLEIFEKEINADILLKEIVMNHVIVKGGEEFLLRVTKWTG
jgi:hypothetical protein